ncbi:MAG: STAS domain-containing protein [bacterium]
MELKFRIRKTGADPHVTVIDLEGGMLSSDVSVFNDELEQLLLQKENRVIINLKNLDFIGSSGIGTIMFTADKLKKRNGELAIVGMNEEIRNVFDHLGLGKFVTVYETEQEAVRAFRSTGE